MGAGSREALYTLQAHMVLMKNSVMSEQNLHIALCVSLLLDYLGSAKQLLCYCLRNNQKENHHHAEHIEVRWDIVQGSHQRWLVLLMQRVGWVAICWENAVPRYLHETGEGSMSRQNRRLALYSFS